MKKLIPADAVLIPPQAKNVFKGTLFDVYQWPQKMFDGSTETFEMLKRPDTVTVIPVINNKILTLEEEQPNSGTRLSFPGGRVDPNDNTTLLAAKREIQEETGYGFDDWKLVKVWQPHTKLEWFIYFYVAWNSNKISEPHLDAGEKIQMKLLPFQEAKSFVVTKAGYLGESKEIFEGVDTLDGLTNLPEFSGEETDR